MAHTEHGGPCPYHPQEQREYVALYPLGPEGERLPEGATGPGITEPHRYSIGRSAYLEQYARMYPGVPLPELPPALLVEAAEGEPPAPARRRPR